MVPLNEQEFVIDLRKLLDARLVLVSRNYLRQYQSFLDDGSDLPELTVWMLPDGFSMISI